jgi:hypothetical protein
MFSSLFILFGIASAATIQHHALPWKLPFHVEGPHIWSSTGEEVQYFGTNWAAHQEAMIPEGLQYSSIRDIVSKMKGFNLNVVRLTYAIEMVDDVLDHGGDVTLEHTLTNALGSANGTVILNKILANNPQFTKDTTRLQVFDAAAAELAAQGIYVHLDNHMSKAIWCCGLGDGNAWFGDTYFNVTTWLRGWEFMASHVFFHSPFHLISYTNHTRPQKIGNHSLLLALEMNFANLMVFAESHMTGIHGIRI